MIDALFDLLTEEGEVPVIDAIADRAGVSVSSVFRYFDGLDDLKNQTIERYFTRYASLFEIPSIGEGAIEGRIERFVDARLRLYDAIAPIARLARAKAYDQPRVAAPLALARATFFDQIEAHFAQELATTTQDAAEERIALIDSLTSFESFDLQHTAHHRSRPKVRASWLYGVARLLAD